ncbi:MAG: hypothetical protein ACJAT7_003511 [Psychromonas sp.]|jgi:hypothetical protein|uniref:IS66 family insertion sequence element accessory protein TnpA n=1 Tax=Psychromonas sp. TaxID=1884585 RepID=UPI0039E2C20B
MARRSSKEWQTIIEQHEISGMSVAEFCKQQGESMSRINELIAQVKYPQMGADLEREFKKLP